MTIELSVGQLTALITLVAMVSACGGVLLMALCIGARRADDAIERAYEDEILRRGSEGSWN